MKTTKDILNFYNTAVFFDYSKPEIEREFNQVRKCIINRFHETIPSSRIVVALSIIDKIILKIFSGEIADILRDLHDLRENIIYMLSFEKTVKGEKEINSDESEVED